MEVTYMKPFGARLTNVDLDNPEHAAQLAQLLYDNGIIFMPAGSSAPGAPVLHEPHNLERIGQFFGSTYKSHPINPTVAETAVEILETGGDSNRVPDSHLFHSDYTWHESPNVASVICCKVKPADGGGSTRFQDAKKMYGMLSPKNRDYLMNTRFLHSLHYGYTNVGAKDKLEGVPDHSYVHPGVIHHPKTSVPLSFINRGFTISEEGKTHEESKPRLFEIFDEIYSEEATYTHDWTVNDVIVWDNMGTNHQAPMDYKALRVMHRVVVRDVENIPRLYVPTTNETEASRVVGIKA